MTFRVKVIQGARDSVLTFLNKKGTELFDEILALLKLVLYSDEIESKIGIFDSLSIIP